MKTKTLRIHSFIAALISALAVTSSGCLNLKPAADTSRYFVLTSPSDTPVASSAGPSVGLGRVEIPDYLQPKRIAIRKGNNEIQYSDTLQWAERLDRGIQRTLRANLASLLGSTNLAMSAWRRSDVQAEVYVSVLRFEADEHGQVILEARWRVMSSGGEKGLHLGTSKITRRGPSFAENPDGATAALSQAITDLSREIAVAVYALREASSRF